MSTGFTKPSDIKARYEAKIAAQGRSDDIPMSQKRAQNVTLGAKPSSVKDRWESKIAAESRADELKAQEFVQTAKWSQKRAQDVPSFAVQPSQARAGVEARVREESNPDDVKAQKFIKKTSREGHDVPLFMKGQDAVKGGIEERVAYEKAAADDKARQFLNDTTYLGVQRRDFKSSLIPLSVLFAKPHKDQVRISPGGKYLAWRTRGRSMGDPQEDDNGTMNLFVKKLEDSTIRQLTFYTELDACVHFQFTPDDKSIVMLRETRRGSENYHLHAIEIAPFFQIGDEKADDPKSPPPAKPRDLIKDPKMTCGIGFAGGVQLWTSSESTARQVYVGKSQIGKYSLFWDIVMIDIDSGKMTMVEQNVMSSAVGAFRVIFLTMIARILSMCCIKMTPPGVPIQWFPDNEMEFRGRIEIDLLRLGAAFCARTTGSTTWKTLHTCTFEESNMNLIGSIGGSGTARMEFNGDQVDIHLCAWKSGGKKSDTTTYDRFDIKRGQYLKRIAGGKEGSDIVGFVSHPKTGLTQFVVYEWEKKVTEVIPKAESFDHSRLEDDIKYIRSYFAKSMTFQIVSRAHADDAWIIYAENDVGHSIFKGSPSAYYLFTRAAAIDRKGLDHSVEVKRNLELIFPSRPEMRKYQLSRMDPVHIKSRDGQDLLCYLSRVPEAPTIKGRQEFPEAPPPPLVVLVHGGPQARDSWGYNPMCQFLCSRGFRVLQVNYRGSTGFGARFLRRGMNGEFYKSLQNDIVDALGYATSKPETPKISAKQRQYGEDDIPPLPWGDPSQLAIMGASFGGYSALWGITSNPGLYKCAVAICPISSVGAADDHSKQAFRGSPLIATYWNRVFGNDVSKNVATAMKASPMYHIDEASAGASIALYHGESDPRAPIQHTYKVMDAMKTCGLAGEVVTFSGEGHGITKEPNSLYMHYRIEEFLCSKFGLPVFDAEDDSKKMEKNTGTVLWSAKYGKKDNV